MTRRAIKFVTDLKQRVKQYGLSLNEDKTKKLTFTKENHEHFNFLGFRFYWGKQGSRKILKIKTQKEKLFKSIQEFGQWIKEIRNKMKLKDIWTMARMKILGHINYYGYDMNAPKLNHFYWETVKLLFKWINRRSQRRSYTWKGFMERLNYFPLMQPLKEGKLKCLGTNPYQYLERNRNRF